MAIDPPHDENPVSPGDLEKPYLTPAEVSDEPIPNQFIGSKGMWLLIVGSIAIGGSAFALFAPRQSTHIKNFGATRSGPPVELEDYESDFAGERLTQTVEIPAIAEGGEAHRLPQRAEPYEVEMPYVQKQPSNSRNEN